MTSGPLSAGTGQAGNADPGKEARAAAGIPIVAAYDGFRTLAIFGVVLFHVIQVNGVLVQAGDSQAAITMWGILPGASLSALFIISGFVMFLPTASRGGHFGSRQVFAVRRVARVIPAYWLSLLIAMVLLIALGPGLPGVGPIAAHFATVQTPVLLFDGPIEVDGATLGSFPLGLGVIAPVWTLTAEVGFYILLAFVASAYYKRPFVGLAIASAVVVVWHFLALNIGDVASLFGVDLARVTEERFALYHANQLPSWGVAMAAGMTSAWLYVRWRDRIEPDLLARRALPFFGAAVTALLLLAWWAGHYAISDPDPFLGLFARQPLGLSLLLPLGVAAVMLAYSLVSPALQRPVTNAPVRWFADISYSVYLIHLAVIWVAINEFSLPRAPGSSAIVATLVWFALTIVVSTVYAYLSARYLERPIRRWARNFRPAPGSALPKGAPDRIA